MAEEKEKRFKELETLLPQEENRIGQQTAELQELRQKAAMLQSRMETLSAEAARIQPPYNSRREAEAESRTLQGQRDRLLRQKETAEEASRQANDLLQNHEGKLRQQKEHLSNAADLTDPGLAVRKTGQQLQQVQTELQKQLSAMKQTESGIFQKQQADSEISAAETALSELDGQILERAKQLSSLQAALLAEQDQLDVLDKKLLFESTEEAQRRQTAAEETLASHRERHLKAQEDLRQRKETYDLLQGQLHQLQEQLLQFGELPDRTLLLAQEQTLNAQRSTERDRQKLYHVRLDRNRSVEDNIRKSSGILAELEERSSWVKALSDTANGTLSGKEKIMLETYVQMSFFDRIVKRANLRFLVMSDNQYELRRRASADSFRSQSGLELDVVDHYNGSIRNVESLSGGESFMASLSLALGLSDEIQSSAGGIRLDTMFVDEGFGSLDENALRQAVKALSGLAESNKLVGIISHVDALKERIDRQIVVTKEKTGGSKVAVVV